MRRSLTLGLVFGLVCGCQAPRSVMVYDTERGLQWHWPHFLDGKPTILAFWSTEEIECLRAVDGLNTLSLRQEPVELISVATGPDLQEIHAWIDGRRGSPIRFPVLLDQEKRLARAVNVTHYPTYVYYSSDGYEIDRSYSIRNIAKWYNSRWLRKSGATYREAGDPYRPTDDGW